MLSTGLYGTVENTKDRAKAFRDLLHVRINARLRNDSAGYDATQAEFIAKSAEARAAAKELYALCPYYIVGLFSDTPKKRSICSLLADIVNNPTYYEHIEDVIYYEVKSAFTSSEAKNSEIVACKLKAYNRRISRSLNRTKDGLKRELDPTRLSKPVKQN